MPIYCGSSPIGEVNISFTSPDGGTNTNDASLASGDQLLNGVTAYSKGKKITGSIPTKTENNLTVADNVVNVPAGYYATACSKEIATIDFPEKEMAVDDSGLISCTSNLTTGGFLSAGKKTTTLQLPVENGKIITPSSIEQTAVAAHKYTTGAVKVAAVPTETKKVTANGTYTPSTGKYFSSVEVAIAGDTPIYQDKTVNPTTSLQTILPDDGYDALSQVKINAISVEAKTATPKTAAQDIVPSEGSYLTKVMVEAVPTETKTIEANGSYSPTNGKFFSEVVVSVPTGSAAPVLQEKTISPTETAQEIAPDSGYDGLSKVNVGAIAADYIGSGVGELNDLAEDELGGYSSWAQISGIQLLVGGFSFDDNVCLKAGTVVPKWTESDQEQIKEFALGGKFQTWQTAESIVKVDGGTINDPNIAMLLYAVDGYTGGTNSNKKLTKGLWFDPAIDMPAMSDDDKQVYFGAATPAQVLSGITFASASGLAQTGTLVVQKYYTGTSAPSASLGNDGDIYMMTAGVEEVVIH